MTWAKFGGVGHKRDGMDAPMSGLQVAYLLEKRKDRECVVIVCPECGREAYEVCADTGKCLICVEREG